MIIVTVIEPNTVSPLYKACLHGRFSLKAISIHLNGLCRNQASSPLLNIEPAGSSIERSALYSYSSCVLKL